MELNSKTIVLTGASSGVGLDLLRALAPRNKIIALSRTPPPRAGADTDNGIHLSTDLMETSSLAAAIAKIRRLSPNGIDGLINCAAVQFTPRFVDANFDPASIAKEIATNLTGPIELTAGLLDLLRAAQEAFILNVNSGLGIVPKSESAVYCATKAGLDNFSRGLRPQLSGTNVRVFQTFLPLVNTPMTEGRGSSKLATAEVAKRIVNQIERGPPDLDIGKVKLLRVVNRLSPPLAHRLMQRGDA